MMKPKKSITFIGPIDQSNKKATPLIRTDSVRNRENGTTTNNE
jgi:hypothetical protein